MTNLPSKKQSPTEAQSCSMVQCTHLTGVPAVHLLCFYSIVFIRKSHKFSVKESMCWTCYFQFAKKKLLSTFNCTKTFQCKTGMAQENTGRGATDMVMKLKPFISSGLKRRNAEGGGCSV